MPEERWNSAAQALTAASLEALAQGQLPAIHVREFATPAECRRLCAAIRTAAVNRVEASTSPMTLIGSNLSNSMHQEKSEYFKSAEQSWEELDVITHRADFHPVERVMETLTEIWSAPVAVASEPDFGRYFAGGIKTRVAGSPLHFDYVPVTTDKYSLRDIVDQLSWNLYLDMPTACGSTTIFNAPIDIETFTRSTDRAKDEPVRCWNNQLPADSVAGRESYTFRPTIGELVLLNTRYPHTVLMDDVREGEWRAQTGSFIGRLADQRLVLWS